MITKKDLEKLGYKIKTANVAETNSTDFRIANTTGSPYLVNLSEDGCITIIFPVNDKHSAFSTCDLVEFIAWHNSQSRNSTK